MTTKHTRSIRIYQFLLTLFSFSFLATAQLHAFDTSVYAEKSVLSENRWVKVSVTETGIHSISAADLRKWGFTNIENVRIYGYGGRRIPDLLSISNYTDDLPLVQTVTTPQNLYFYAVGPVTWNSIFVSQFRQSSNPFSDYGYYYITESNEPAATINQTGTPGANAPVTKFTERIYHEKDILSIGETGHLLVGENFKTKPIQSFEFDLTDYVEGDNAWINISLVARSINDEKTRFAFTTDGEALTVSPLPTIGAVLNETKYHGKEGNFRGTFKPQGDRLTVGINAENSTSNYIQSIYLDYITINYQRHLRMNGGKLQFTSKQAGLKLEGADATTRIWDVTDPLNITQINSADENGARVWTSSFGSQRDYVAWNENASFPTPTYVESVDTQNIHGMSTPDMVIFTLPQWKAQAERLADIHRQGTDSLSVIVLDVNQVYNEFSSGSPDVNSLRRCLKMFYDRGEAQGTPLKYAILMGRSTHDNRQITDKIKALNLPTIPCWQSDSGLSDSDSFSTDDIIVFLADNSGSQLSRDKPLVALGRLPVTTVNEAKNAVDKIHTYIYDTPRSGWKNNVLLIADDDDSGVHMKDIERMYNGMLNSTGGCDMHYQKVYIDAYDKVGSIYPQARTDMFRALDEGVLWWHFMGHANPTSWTADGLMTYNDINSLYLRHWPIVYAGTCDFMRWDSATTSAAELLFKNTHGGVIAVISATRPVYISENGDLAEVFGEIVFERDKDGRYLPVGEALRRAKYNYRTGATPIPNENKLKYVFLGDPAMRPATPANRTVITEINGTPVDGDNQPVIMAAQRASVKGYINDGHGNIMTDFNGKIETVLYDADISTTSKGNGKNGKEVTFDQHGNRLYAGSDSVKNGEFSLSIAMPSEIADNFRPATLDLYAVTDNKQTEATGVCRDFYVYGFDDSAPADTISPSIDNLFLNHSSFTNGSSVNESPTVIAYISDNVGINLSNAGVGHQMILWLDGTRSFNDVSNYYTPSADGSPSGTITYPLQNLSDGTHTIRLRIWDTSGNSDEATIEFNVVNGMPGEILSVYTDANPATVEANFYLTHNRPDAMVTITMEIYNMLGQRVWSSQQSGRSDLFTSFPITWNLTDLSGRRVTRGIYLYRATMIEADGSTSNSVTKKIAVAAG
ncbi:MAG: type IX secretion system sortase PorU [Muribaculaceae bacterium]|nr:type IX secretion system sortase PorU [Muribaculaceae bacterium]